MSETGHPLRREDLVAAAEVIRERGQLLVFTGAGISVESGVPPFRGPDGLWEKYDPDFIELHRFLADPDSCWPLIHELFFHAMLEAEPNDAHRGIAALEKAGYVRAVVTQNIDGLHQKAGSRHVLEFHGTTRTLSCVVCHEVFAQEAVDFNVMPPLCGCGGVLKPDFIFFSEPIPDRLSRVSFAEAAASATVLIVGTAGAVVPAAYVPLAAKKAGATIIEVNTSPSAFTGDVTDIFLKGTATEVVPPLVDLVLGEQWRTASE